jgi:hypothetical protein
MAVFNWYMKRQWLDFQPDIEAVNLHYTWAPLGTPPDWNRHRETRLLEKNAMVAEGMGGTVLSGDEMVNQELKLRPAYAPPSARVKIIKLPARIQDPRASGGWTENYLFHHYYEVFQGGRVWTTDLFTEEIVSREVELVDWKGNATGACAHWAVFDFDATQYVPSETREFVERYGEDNDFRSHKFYRHPNRDQYQREKFRMMSDIPLPHVWRSRVWGPRGATVIQGWHVAYLDELPPADQPLRIREEWTGYQTLTL